MIKQPNGSALLTSILVVAIASMLASAITWKSYSSIMRVEAQKDIAQARWISKASIDYARWILIADIRGLQGQSVQIDHLEEPWAQEIPYIKINKLFTSHLSHEEKNYYSLAGLSGEIKDEQSKFNLARITDSKNSLQAEISLKMLFGLLSVEETIFYKFLKLLKKENQTLFNASLSDLEREDQKKTRWKILKKLIKKLNLNQLVEKKLIDRIVWLPKSTPININTASIEVIAATLNEPNKDKLKHLFETVRRFPIRSQSEIYSLYDSKFISKSLVDVKSDFFVLSGYSRFGKAELSFKALLRRKGFDAQLLQLENI